MAFVDTYKFGSLWYDSELHLADIESGEIPVTALVKEHLELLKDSGAEFTFDETGWGDNDVQVQPILIMGVGGYPGDSVDDSNARVLKEWATDLSGAFTHSTWFGGCEHVQLYLDVNIALTEEVEQVIEWAEGFMNYPVLDESDWSELGWERHEEAVQEAVEHTQEEREGEGLPVLTDEQVEILVENWNENYGSGYFEEGYIPSEEWNSIVDDVLSGNIQLHQDGSLF